VRSTAHIPVGIMETGVRALVVGSGDGLAGEEALVEAAVSGEDTLGDSAGVGASAEAMVAAMFILPGEMVQIS
jgi:hypothetical protein